ncbi:MAG: hypothetical protein COX62_02765 [Deltaproteobacteria bacterium CG_4_10_14_0_2_um_filter_43_8]|nr:MAG: hypothetical protein COV43_05025 [Deltaproteobacteria bacterium CG11_big_fil_rev_8_21_14_0_20_42_23]PJA21314.1 MAG: hypothetical protein COX62_02765 [Deltaproteobacteria bacterium CG_4_10_14_0_2_um_filter_43_8]PJC63593.1 MAG: hypothetical protein CO021_08505 [Deltaproteobacteria bacterium CG_4_9_14_0_2_um_filter_42_21]
MNQKPAHIPHRLSVPVRVLLITGTAAFVLWFFGLFFSNQFEASSSQVFGISLSHFLFVLQVFLVSLTAAIASYRYYDKPLSLLRTAVDHAKKGSLYEKIELQGDDELTDLARQFNEMMKQLDTLYRRQVEVEKDLAIADEALKYKRSLEEKNLEIEHSKKKLEFIVKDLSLIHEIGQKVNSVTDLDKLYAHLTSILKRYLHIDEFAIMVYNDGKEEMQVKAAYGFVNISKVMKTTFQRGEGISSLAAEMGRKIYVADVSKDPRFLHYKLEDEGKAGSFLSIPLAFKKDILGVINFARSQVHAFSANDVRMLSLVASQVALAIMNARLYTQTRELSVKDELTGVYNRRHFQRMLHVEWKRAVRFRRDLSVVMVDVDHFKEYNDSFGHLLGDDVLKKLGNLFVKNLREVDTVARFGGEEFVLLLPDTDKHGAIAVSEKLRRLVEKQRFFSAGQKETRTVTISLGLSTYPDDVGEIEELVDFADIALYRSKERGRNQVTCYAPPTPRPVKELEGMTKDGTEKPSIKERRRSMQ